MPVLAVFDGQANWRDTHVCDGWISDHLARPQRTLDSAGLFYLPTAEGYLGLLVEGGEWVAIPAGAPHFFDAGEAASPDGLPAALPRFEAFVEEVLAMTGNDASDE